MTRKKAERQREREKEGVEDSDVILTLGRTKASGSQLRERFAVRELGEEGGFALSRNFCRVMVNPVVRGEAR